YVLKKISIILFFTSGSKSLSLLIQIKVHSFFFRVSTSTAALISSWVCCQFCAFAPKLIISKITKGQIFTLLIFSIFMYIMELYYFQINKTPSQFYVCFVWS